MELTVRIEEDTARLLDGFPARLDKRIGRVAAMAAGEMRRGARKRLGTALPMSPAMRGHGALGSSIAPDVKRRDFGEYTAIAGVPPGQEGSAYSAFVEFGTGPHGARGASLYAGPFRWPPIKYSVPRIVPKTKRALSWMPRGRGTLIATARGYEQWAKGGKVRTMRRITVRSTMGQYPHPYLTPQPERVQGKAQQWLQDGVREEWAKMSKKAGARSGS